MVHEVVVVGGGIGGLTVAALLAARGVDVCLLERGAEVGGVIAPLSAFGYTFDPGLGIYPSWEAGGIHDQVFSELKATRPEVSPAATAYVVRLDDGNDIVIRSDDDQFFAALEDVFPESAQHAVEFYQRCSAVKQATKVITEPVSAFLINTSLRFRQFIDAQLQLLTQSTSEVCNFELAALALTTARRSSFSIKGGAAALANSLADAIKQHGGRIRLNSPVLRLAYDSAADVRGVDLLTGETVVASRAIVSNLTIWDTYGKLVGLNRTPSEIRKSLNSQKAPGAFLVYLGLDEAAATNLPDNRILALGESHESFNPNSQIMLTVASGDDARAPAGKRAATLFSFTDADDWFSFHESIEGLEEQEQSALAEIWQRLETRIPEALVGAELIETWTPHDCYETTRRKLGYVGRPSGGGGVAFNNVLTSVPNLYVVGDTVAAEPGLAGVTRSALALANRLTKPPKN
jgi:phytoene dehydrogenase-like protein